LRARVLQRCLQQHLTRKQDCPTCRNECSSVFDDKKQERRIKNTIIKCPNDECDWSDGIGTLCEHLSLDCQFEMVPCPFSCDVSLVRKEMTCHCTEECLERNVTCSYCDCEIVAKEIDDHNLICPDFPVSCPNDKCSIKLIRKNLPTHANECAFEIVTCHICKKSVIRQDLQSHSQESTQNHIDILFQKNQHLLKQIKSISKVAEKPFSMIFWINQFDMKREHNKICEKSFDCAGYHLSLKVFSNGNGVGEGSHVSIFLNLKQGNDDDSLPWPYQATYTCSILNQDEDNGHITHSVNTENEAYENKCWEKPTSSVENVGFGFSKFASHQDLRSPYLKGNKLAVRVEVKMNKPWLFT